ncbi:MAG: response regulator [Lentisphaeraceae bacterium]|nr:response regulator [Lentisphaeraceae bacterium]
MEKVLFIDDEPRVLHSLKLNLFGEDYTVVTAKSAEEAMKVLKENEIAVIVSDQRMPGTLGVELLEKAKKMYPSSVRVMMTGECEFSAMVAAINKAEIFQFLKKPFSAQKLKEIVNKGIRCYRETKVITKLKGPGLSALHTPQRLALSLLVEKGELIDIRDLLPGMILEDEIRTRGGLLLLNRDHAISIQDLSHIRAYRVRGNVHVLRRAL